MIYADLHIHSNYSDGTQSLDRVFAIAKEKGIQVAAITDHDTLFHYDDVRRAARANGIKTIRGVEMSCYDFDAGKKVHIVALNPGENPVHVEKLCGEVLEARDACHRKLIGQLREKGFDITYEDAKAFSPYNIVFKMHIFMALVKKYPEMLDLKKYRAMFASQTSPEVDRQMHYIDVKQGIQAALEDGGIPILAHPCEYGNYEEIPKYVSWGLRGIEVSHPSMGVGDYAQTHRLAREMRLLQSGGSDFHDPHMMTLGKFGLTQAEFEELAQCMNL